MKFFKTRRGFITTGVTGILGFLGMGFLFKKEDKKMKKLLHIVKKDQKHWVGNGFHVQTMFAPSRVKHELTSPFILMDYAEKKKFGPSEKKRGVGEHPHRGFETVTFAFEGEIEHRDSAGGGGLIGKGDVQWMTAAGGLVHDEFHSTNFTKKGGDFEMVQLWVNLPSKNKLDNPRYQGVQNTAFPRVELNAHCEAKVIAGELKGAKGPCQTHTPINLYDIKQKKAHTVDLNFDEGSTLLVLSRRGETKIDGQIIAPGELAILSQEGTSTSLDLSDNAEVLILNGEPIREPIVAYGPFVMNTQEEIVQAIQDFNAGKMGTIN